MRIFDEEKKQEIFSPDLSQGYLREDKLLVARHAAKEAVVERGHWETKAEYPNGGKDVEWIVDVPAQTARAAYEEYEDIYVFVPYTQSELESRRADALRARRAAECFSVVDRGTLWYDKLTAEQRAELSAWYEAWLNAPETGEAPTSPSWIKRSAKI